MNVDGAEETVRLLLLSLHSLHQASYTPPQLYIFSKDGFCV